MESENKDRKAPIFWLIRLVGLIVSMLAIFKASEPLEQKRYLEFALWILLISIGYLLVGIKKTENYPVKLFEFNLKKNLMVPIFFSALMWFVFERTTVIEESSLLLTMFGVYSIICLIIFAIYEVIEGFSRLVSWKITRRLQ